MKSSIILGRWGLHWPILWDDQKGKWKRFHNQFAGVEIILSEWFPTQHLALSLLSVHVGGFITGLRRGRNQDTKRQMINNMTFAILALLTSASGSFMLSGEVWGKILASRYFTLCQQFSRLLYYLINSYCIHSCCSINIWLLVQNIISINAISSNMKSNTGSSESARRQRWHGFIETSPNTVKEQAEGHGLRRNKMAPLCRGQ